MSDPISPNERRARELMQRYFDREMSSIEAEELLALWNERPEWKEEAAENYRIEYSLRFLQQVKERPLRHEPIFLSEPLQYELFALPIDRLHACLDHREFEEKNAETGDARDVVKIEKRKGVKPVTPKKNGFYTTVRWAVAVAVLCVGGQAIYNEFEPLLREKDSNSNAVAFHPTGTVDAVLDVRWPEGVEQLKPGQRIEAENIRFESGVVQVTLENGVRLALEGPIDLQVDSPSQTVCRTGRLSATVPETGKGFEIRTPFARITDLGTEFALNVDEKSVQTHMILGEVEVDRISGNKKERLVTGRALSVESRGTLKHFEANPDTFLSRLLVRQRIVAQENREFDRWRNIFEAWQADPGLLVFFDFQEPDDAVLNRSEHQAVGDGRLVGAARTDGRWTGKRAVAFRAKRDAVRIEVPQALRGMTLFASIRIDGLRRFNQVLLSSSTTGAGTIDWQLWNDGSLRFSIRPDSKSVPQRYDSKPVFYPRHWGAWYRLATVVDADAGQIVHYVDGREIARLPIKSPVPLRIGSATLGNDFREDRTTDRSFDGLMDQFLLFDRELSVREIRSLSVY